MINASSDDERPVPNKARCDPQQVEATDRPRRPFSLAREQVEPEVERIGSLPASDTAHYRALFRMDLLQLFQVNTVGHLRLFEIALELLPRQPNRDWRPD